LGYYYYYCYAHQHKAAGRKTRPGYYYYAAFNAHVSVIVMPNRRRSWVLWSMVWLRLWLGLRGRCSRGEEHMSHIRRISLDRAPVTSKPILRVPRCVDGRHRTRSTDRPTVHTNNHLRTATRRVTATRSTLIHLHARGTHPAARQTID